MEFLGKVVLITGAAGGIGTETARLFAKQGAKLALVDLDYDRLKKVALELELQDYLLLPADVTKEDQVGTLVQKTRDQYGKIDVFFNNAGIEGKVANLTEIAVEDFQRVFNVNVMGVFFGLKYVGRVMMEQKSGAIVNTASIAGLNGSSGLGPYVASKHAVIGLTKTAAIEYAAANVRVNAICPGFVETRMMYSIFESKYAEPNDERMKMKTPLQRYAKPQEIAEMVSFLASDRASYVTGSCHLVDGGVTSF